MDRRIWHDHYDEGIPADFHFVDRTLPQALERSAANRGDSTAIWFMNRRLSYHQLKDQVDRLATALSRLGVTKGTRVALQLPNLPQTVIANFAVLRLGANVVMTSPLYTEREIEHQWKDAGCEVAIVMDFLWERRIRALRASLPVKHYIVASIPEYLAFPLNLLAPLKLKKAKPPMIAHVRPEPGVHFFRALVDATPASPPQVEVGLDDVAVLQYTGGTTGVAKGAVLTHRNLSVNVQGIAAWLHIGDFADEVVLAALPFFHVFGMTVTMNFPVWSGCAMVVIPNPRDFGALMQAVAKRRVTLFMGVPAMFNGINNDPRVKTFDLSCVKSCFSGSAPLPVDVLERFEALTGSRIVEGFGMTETSPVTHVNPLLTKRKVGSIGVPIIATDSKIVDLETGRRELPVGEDGELVVRGPQVMRGYWNRPDETAAMIHDGWLHTGDIAHMDEEGYFFISGRKKEMIIVSGYNVYPDEVDRVLMAHPAVLEAATIGLPDPRCGERVKSFVALRPQAQASAEDLIAHCRANLANFKVPRDVEFRAELPKSSVLKILRRELRAQELERLKEAGGGGA
jgi:long-chain acyl-CoA synthetase